MSAFEAARLGPASRWAPEALQTAEASLRDALLGWSRQEASFFPLRDFRPVAGQLTAAETLAREAARLGEERRAEGRFAAEEALRQALSVEGHAAALVAVTSLPHGQRVRLQRARLLVRESETLLRDGELDSARERADRARVELREALGPVLEVAERFTSQEQIATWRAWIEQTRAWSRSADQPAIVVLKEKNSLVLFSKGLPERTYDVEVGRNVLGVKQQQGDSATPEGRYRIVGKRERGQSEFHSALLLDYPNGADRQRFAAAQRRGEIPRGAGIGGFIEIHGGGGRGRNWTEGCVAISNRDMDDLFARVGVGTWVTIVGGDGRNGAFSDLLARIGAAPENARP